MRYIDPYQLGMAVQESMYKNPHEDPKVARNHRFEHEHFLRLIALAPDADVEPVVHGRWRLETDEEEPNLMFKLVVCSACGKTANGMYNYCPNCGAKMEAKVEHDITKEGKE